MLYILSSFWPWKIISSLSINKHLIRRLRVLNNKFIYKGFKVKKINIGETINKVLKQIIIVSLISLRRKLIDFLILLFTS